MRLTELDPQWVHTGGEGVSDSEGNPVPFRDKIALSFLCPCDECTAKRTGDPDKDYYLRVLVPFTNPPDGLPVVELGVPTWYRKGETFEDMVLTPSILRKDKCKWHGFVGGPQGDKPGEVVTL